MPTCWESSSTAATRQPRIPMPADTRGIIRTPRRRITTRPRVWQSPFELNKKRRRRGCSRIRYHPAETLTVAARLRAPEVDLALAASRVVVDDAARDRLRRCARQSLDWGRAFRVAVNCGVSSLVYWNLQRFAETT